VALNGFAFSGIRHKALIAGCKSGLTRTLWDVAGAEGIDLMRIGDARC
jgi:hypothetical protein